jgi:hypothetical protein
MRVMRDSPLGVVGWTSAMIRSQVVAQARRKIGRREACCGSGPVGMGLHKDTFVGTELQFIVGKGGLIH